MVIDSDNKVEGSPKMPEEDDVEGFATDEPRPMKKIKSATNEECCTGNADNGCHNFYLSWDLYFLGIYLLLCICVL